MKTITYPLIVFTFSILACSLMTAPTAKETKAQLVKNIYLTTPTNDPEPGFNTIPAACTVSAQSLNLRSCGDLHCPVIAWLTMGDILEVLDIDQNWIKVSTPAGQTGWVHSKYCGGT
jgi:SH3-like domain-containing protein